MSRHHSWPILPDGRQVRINATSHVLEVYESDLSTLSHSTGGSSGIGLWATGTAYTVGTHVNSGDRLYRCTTAHTAAAAFATDAANWTEVSNGASGGSGEIQLASPTGTLLSDPDLNFNSVANLLTIPNMQVTGTLRWFDPKDVPSITADVNDFAPFGAGNLAGSIWAVTGDAANRSITGIDATAIPDGTSLTLLNKGAFNILLRGSSGSSTIANRFGWTGDWILRPGESAPLIYSTDLTRWAALAPVPQASVVSHTDSVVGAIAVNDATSPPWPVPITGTLAGVRVTCGAALTGGSVTVTVTRISPAAFTTDPVVTVASGAITTLFTPGTTTPVAPGDLLVATVTALTATNLGAANSALSVQYNIASA